MEARGLGLRGGAVWLEPSNQVLMRHPLRTQGRAETREPAARRRSPTSVATRYKILGSCSLQPGSVGYFPTYGVQATILTRNNLPHVPYHRHILRHQP